MSATVYGTFCNPPQQFGLSFYCANSSACDIFRSFSAVKCLSQASQLYCTNQVGCAGANFTNDIYIDFPLDGGRTATAYDTVTRQSFAFNSSFPIVASESSKFAQRDIFTGHERSLEKVSVPTPNQVSLAFKAEYNASTNPSRLLVDALGATLFKNGTKGGTSSIAMLQAHIRDALFVAVQSTTGKATTQVKQCQEVKATKIGIIGLNDRFISNITNQVPQVSFATWLLTAFVGHTIANEALTSEIDIIKSDLKKSVATCSSTTSSTKTTSTTTSSTTTPTATAGCDTIFALSGASETAFNPAGQSFSASLPCAALNASSIAVTANYVAVKNFTATQKVIKFKGFSEPEVLLAIYARDIAGNPILNSFQLLFGSDSLPVTVQFADGTPAPNVHVQATATIYTDVTQNRTTNTNGRVVFVNLPGTTVGLVARTSDGQLAINGVASSASQVNMQLIPYGTPSNVSNWNFSHGLEGWSNGSLEKHVEKRQNFDLFLSTDGTEDLQTSGGNFNAHPFTTTIYVRYRFQTNEVPGGYFGSQYNDYYSVSIRSNTSQYVTVTNSMNALGLGAFDENGYTDWYTLKLDVPKEVAKSARVDIAVANVADNQLDSQIIIDKAGDIDCETCGDCATCPSDPMCQQACKDPPPQSCAFYANCVEATVPCHGDPNSYAIEFGNYYCNKYRANIEKFSASGQSFVWGTAICLQRALIPSVTCDASCSSIESAAFQSHPKCYVDNGFCDLSCRDLYYVFTTVLGGLFSRPGAHQAFSAAKMCGGKLPDGLKDGSCEGIVAELALSVIVAILAVIV